MKNTCNRALLGSILRCQMQRTEKFSTNIGCNPSLTLAVTRVHFDILELADCRISRLRVNVKLKKLYSSLTEITGTDTYYD